MEDRLKGKIIAIDFDSTIHHCPSWKGVGVFGKPITGVQWALKQFKSMGATIIVYTCRRESNLISDYMKEHKIPYDYINYSTRNAKLKLSDKIAADIYIDDKGINFSGEWHETYRQVVNFTPWEKKDAKAITS